MMMTEETIGQLFRIVDRLNMTIEDDQMEKTGQARSTVLICNGGFAEVHLGGNSIWSSEDSEAETEEGLEKEIREGLKELVEAVSNIKV